jgi:hypothetical protein
MRRNRLTILVLVLCGFGCRQPAPERVYVDFEAVLASYKASPLPSHPLPKPPNGLPDEVVSVPAVAPRTVVVQGVSGAKADALLEENRKEAVAELSKLLSRRYEREAQRAGEKRIRELDPKKQAAYLSAQKAVEAEFQTYAVARSPLVARLASIVGFPDPNPTSIPPAATTAPLLIKRLTEAADLRKQMAILDANYENKIQDLLSQAGKQYGTDLADIEKQIDADRQDAMRRAEAEAVAEATKTYTSLRPILMGPAKVDLPGEPAQSVTLPAVPAPIAAPEVRERTLTAAQRRSILKSQLDVWVQVNGYELAKSPNDGKDMTADFVKWRQERKL